MIILKNETLQITRDTQRANKLTIKQLRQLIAKSRMHSAKLIWVTPDAEQLIGKIARVSNPKNEDNPWSRKTYPLSHQTQALEPFEMASMCVEITLHEQLHRRSLRHRSFSFQEFSQRYAIPTDTFATVPQI